MQDLLNHRKWKSIIPSTGNEYDQHKFAKKRILQTMIDLNFKNIEAEKDFPCDGKPYKVDCYGEYFGGQRKIAVEIHGKKGHNSHKAAKKDEWRRLCIEDMYGVKFVTLQAANLGPDMPDRFIEQELLDAATR